MNDGKAVKQASKPIYAHDPNFPSDLRITPSSLKRKNQSKTSIVEDEAEAQSFDIDNEEDIEAYGIAGRIWEAAYALKLYLQPPTSTESNERKRFGDTESNGLEFDPPCSLFNGRKRVVALELGAGAGYAGLHLAQTLSTFRASAGHRSLESGSEGEQTESKQLKNSSIISQDQGRDVVILTDLDNVCPLLSRNAARASQSQSHSQASKFSDSASGESQKSPESAQAFKMGEKVETRVRPLSWGDEEQSFKVLEELKVEKGEASSTSKEVNMDVNEDSWDRFQEHPLTHLILSDLVYFPELLPPLLRSVITLTDPIPKTFKSSLSPLHTSHSTPKSEETRTPPRNSAEPSSSPEDLSSKIPEVILAYKIRSFAKEEPFWRAFGSWFDFEAVGCTEKQDSSTSKGKDGKRWRRFGKEIKDLNPLKETSNSSIFEQPSTEQPEEEEKGDSIYVFIAKRKSTSIGYSAPSDDISLMSGKRLKRQANKFKEEGINKIDETSELGTEKSKGEGKGKEIEMEEFEIVDEGSGDFFELMLMGDMEV